HRAGLDPLRGVPRVQARARRRGPAGRAPGHANRPAGEGGRSAARAGRRHERRGPAGPRRRRPGRSARGAAARAPGQLTESWTPGPIGRSMSPGGPGTMATGRFVIVGASLAGASAATALRDGGFEGELTLIGEEARLPYSRPALSKGYLRGQESFEAQLVNPAADYERRRITVRVGARATRVDPARRVVELAGGEVVGYDRLLVTTGGRNRSLRSPGADLPGIFQLRTVEECDRIRAAARAGARAVVVGMGFIGSEVSASLRQMGVAVSVVEGNPVPLARALGPEVGAVLAAIHRDHGVELVLGDSVAAFEGAGRVERVRTGKGRVLPCDFVVAGIGIVPNQ